MVTRRGLPGSRSNKPRQAASDADGWRPLADAQPALIIEADPTGRLSYISEGWELYTGIPQSDLLRDLLVAAHPDDRERVRAELSEAVRAGRPARIEWRLLRGDGAHRWHLGVIIPVRDATGAVSRWVGAMMDADDRVRADAALRESEERYRTIIDAANEGVLLLGPDDRVTYANERFAAMLGYTQDETVGRPLFDFMDDEAARQAHANVARRRLGVSEQFDFRFQHRSGRPVWAIVSAQPLRGPNGEYAGSLTMITDITHRKRVEEALRESEERLHVVEQAAAALIVMTTPAGEIEYISESYAQYSGLSLEQARDWQRNRMIHRDDLDQAMTVWGQALQTGEPMQNEMRLRRHDGEYRWYLVQGTPVRNDDGTIRRWVTVSVDIHDRKLAAERERYLADARAVLTESLDYGEALRQLVGLLVPRFADYGSIIVRRADGELERIAEVHRREDIGEYATEPLRLNLDSPVGVPAVVRTGRPELLTTITDDFYASFADPVQGDAARRLGFRSALIVPLRFSDANAGALTVASSQDGRYGEPELAFLREFASHAAIALDKARLFSDLRDTAAHLARANAAKDEFLGMVSHELKTPITTILGNASILLRHSSSIDEEARRQALNDIYHYSDQLHRIIDNLLVLARLEQGQQIDMEPMLISKVVTRVVDEQQRRQPHRKFSVVGFGDPRTVLANSAYVEQVLKNLLSNAAKYSPHDAEIEIRVERDPEQVRLSVLDRGPGIPEEERERIFQPFYRSASTADRAQGIGIGLAVCKRLIEAQGGRIEVEPREGGGSAFHIALPVDVEGQED